MTPTEVVGNTSTVHHTPRKHLCDLTDIPCPDHRHLHPGPPLSRPFESYTMVAEPLSKATRYLLQ